MQTRTSACTLEGYKMADLEAVVLPLHVPRQPNAIFGLLIEDKNTPVMSNNNCLLNTLVIQNIHHTLRTHGSRILLRLQRLTRFPVSQDIRRDASIPELLKMRNCMSPDPGSVREAVDEEDGSFVGWGSRSVVVVGVARTGEKLFVEAW